MKKLVKIKLINWYTFVDSTIEIKNNSLIAGMNGSGKSTLLDAIQYVLTGGKAKFNQAAGEVTKRTVESYIKAKVGLVSKEFLRTGDVTSYICLEFYDEDKKQSDLLGVCLEIAASMSKANRLFFKLSNTKISDDLFMSSDYIKTIREFKLVNIKDKELTDNSNEFRKIIRYFLGLSGNDKYFELLIKSLFFKSISDVDDFVNNFLLTQKNVSLDNLKLNVENLSNLLNDIRLEKEKIESLKLIVDDINKYDDKLEENDKLSYFLKLITIEKLNSSINKNNKDYNNNSYEIDKLKNEKVENDKKIKDNKKLIGEYDLTLQSNETYKLKLSLEKELDNLKNEQSKLDFKVKEFISFLENDKKMLKNFSCGKILNKNVDLKDISNLEKYLNESKEELDKEKSSLAIEKINVTSLKDEVKRNLDEVEEKIKLLNLKKRPYKEEVTSLQSEIKNYFVSNYKKDIEVRPMCEYIEIIDEKWRNAIEGYLNTQRFDLIVAPEYFDEALNIYENKKKEKKIFGVGLVNVRKLEDEEILDGTLANYIDSDNIYAKRYAIYLLNKVVCCENVSTLKNYKNSITPTCMTYKNNVARQINPLVYKFYYLGNKAIEQQLNLYLLEKEKFVKSYNGYVNILKEVCDKISILSNSNINKIISLYPYCERFYRLKEKYNKVFEQVSSLVIDGIFNNIIELKEKLVKEVDSLDENNENIRQNISKLTIRNEDINKQIDQDKNRLNEIKENLIVNEDYDLLFKNDSGDSLVSREKNYLNKLDKLKSEINYMSIKIEESQKEFNDKYQFDEIPSIDNNKTYVDLLSTKEEQDLVRYESKSMELKEQCQITFREDFLSKLRDNIEESQEEIKRLNSALKDKKFGNERYEFIWDSSNNPELANYYRIIMSNSDYEMNNLFDDLLSVQDRSVMDELFERLSSSSSDEVANKALEMYIDYRNYMSYDIKITKEDGETYLFSKVSKEKSGGEIQTPFYVIIASAFQQLLNSKRSSLGCFVMFDEAFNNMDEKRIKAMMDFYNKLNIQVMISVSPEKVNIISSCVDTTLIVVSNNYISDIKSIIREVNYE